jgi:hypothetical protein
MNKQTMQELLKKNGIRVKGALLTGKKLTVYVYPYTIRGTEYCEKNFFKGDNCYFFFQ